MTSPPPPSGARPIFGSAQLSEEEVRDALVGGAPLLRHRWLVMAVSAVLVVAWLRAVVGQGPIVWPDILPFLAVAATFWTMLLVGPRRHARKTMKALGFDQGEIDYRFDDDGLTTRAPGESSTVSYRMITRLRETRLTFLVDSSPGLSQIIPKRAFSPGDLEAVRALLETHVGPMKGRR